MQSSKSNQRKSLGRSDVVLMVVIGLLIAAAITFFILRIIGHSEEHVEKVKKTKIFYRENLSWRPDASLCEKRILEDLKTLPKRKRAKYGQITLTQKAMKYIGAMKSLKSLELNESKFEPEWLKHLANMQLQVLFLHGTPVNDRGLREVIKISKLEQLEIGDSEVTDEGLKLLANLNRLTVLDLELAKQVTNDGVKNISKMKQIENLNLSYTSVDQDCLDILVSLPRLKTLKFRGIPLDKVGISKLIKMTNLRTLVLNSCNLDDDDLKRISKFRNLKALDLSENPFTDKGLLYIGGLKRLRILALKDCANITEKGVRAIEKELPRTRINYSLTNFLKGDYNVDDIKQEVKLFEKRQLEQN